MCIRVNVRVIKVFALKRPIPYEYCTVYDLGCLPARDLKFQVKHGPNVNKDNHAFLPSLELIDILYM
jgi:hypothetical protein